MFTHRVREFASNSDGATAIEYSLIASLIGVALIPVLHLVGFSLTDLFDNIANRLHTR